MIVAPGIARQHVGREQHELAVGIDDVAGGRHDAEPVAVAVEREAELAVALRSGAIRSSRFFGWDGSG